MMASTKKNTKKQDEKHLKILRELCSLPHNKKCFDCGQRGPTYVNMTIGSFVCTSCSGILRGLNPQHRVKSISMTSFTPSEIEFLQKTGNEVCRRSWLGLWNSPNPPEPESRDELKVKDFMMQKYDRKTWYIPPSQLPPASPKTDSSTSLPERKPLKHLLGENAPAVVVHQEAPPVVRPTSGSSVPQLSKPSPAKQPVNDLLGDLGGDPFAQPAAPTSFNAFGGPPQAQPQPGGFDVFGSPQPSQQQQQQPQHQAQQFGAFDAFSSGAQQQSGGAFDAFGSSQFQEPQRQQQQQQQLPGFNAFSAPPVQQQQQKPPQQQQLGGFSPFGTSPPRQQQQQGSNFNAFGSTQNQQPVVTKQSSFGAFGGQQPVSSSSSSFDAFGSFTTSSVPQQTKTTPALGGFGPMVSASASAAPSSSSTALSHGDRYAALSDLDSIFKVQSSTPSGGQGSAFNSSSGSSTGLGMSSSGMFSGGMSGMSSSVSSGMSSGSTTGMSSGPNPFTSIGGSALPSQSNPFQSSGGGMMVQANGFAGGNPAFGSNPRPASTQNLNFAGAGMTAMAANQFSKMGGSQPGMFGNPGGAGTLQHSSFATGQAQFASGISGQSVGGQFGGSQFGGSQLGGNQFGSGQLASGHFGGTQPGGAQFGGGQFGGQFGGVSLQQQQQSFGGMTSSGQFSQTAQQQQQFPGGWQQKAQSNPFMQSAGGPPAQRQSTNPFM